MQTAFHPTARVVPVVWGLVLLLGGAAPLSAQVIIGWGKRPTNPSIADVHPSVPESNFQNVLQC